MASARSWRRTFLAATRADVGGDDRLPRRDLVHDGLAAGRGRARRDEGPQRQVTFARAFALGRHEVTFAQWDACVAAGGCGGYKPDDRGWGRGPRPVINVSWNDAQEFAVVAARQDRRALSAADRGRMGICGAGGDDDAVLDRARRSRRRRPIRRQLHLRLGGKGSTGSARWRWTIRHFRPILSGCFMCTAMSGSGCRTAIASSYDGAPVGRDLSRWTGMIARTRPARRLLGRHPEEPPLRRPQQVRAGRPERRCRLPGGEDAYPLILYLFISWGSGGEAPGADFW